MKRRSFFALFLAFLMPWRKAIARPEPICAVASINPYWDDTYPLDGVYLSGPITRDSEEAERYCKMMHEIAVEQVRMFNERFSKIDHHP